jgi:hypothetical protein
MGYRLRATGYGQKRALSALISASRSKATDRSAFSFLTPASRLRAIAHASLGAAIAIALSGCGNIEPWVKPYEREALADPIMTFDAHPVSTSYMHHVFEAREGARGALGSAGGGCGCN